MPGNLDTTVEDFLEWIKQSLESGRGVLPLIGAGFSAPSGVPVIAELEDYLRGCIYLAIMPRTTLEVSVPRSRRWCPRTDRWPSISHPRTVFWPKLSSEQRGDIPCSSIDLWLQCILQLQSSASRLREARANPGDSFLPEKEEQLWYCERKMKLYAEAFGSMQDWRSSLLFLSRLVSADSDAAHSFSLPRLSTPSSEVVDNCFRQILENKKPSLGHRMLAALAGALRMDLVLTTNFDDLVERAFREARNDIQVFEVFVDKHLPRYTEVDSSRSLIKIHGGRLALRADYSLDDPPGRVDLDHFLEYLLSEQGRRQFEHSRRTVGHVARLSGKYQSSKDLLVVGFSGADERVNLLVEHALTHLGPEFKVYWIYFSENDRSSVQRRFPAHVGRFVLIGTASSGLLLFQLYQYLRNSLPPAGSVFPSASRITIPPKNSSRVASIAPTKNILFGLFKADMRQNLFSPELETSPDIVVAHGSEASVGLTSACADVFREAETRLRTLALWIDLDSVNNADHLYEVLLDATYYRIGVEDWIPSTSAQLTSSQGDFKSRAQEIGKLVDQSGKHCIIFLNARQTPGASSTVPTDQAIINRNGWLDIETSSGSANRSAFFGLVGALATFGSCSVVLVCTTTPGELTHPPAWQHMNKSADKKVLIVKPIPYTVDLPAINIQESCETWVTERGGEESKRRAFLETLTLMQRPILPAALWSSAFQAVWGLALPARRREEMVTGWLKTLRDEVGLVRFIPGGLVWVQADHRRVLQQWIAKSETLSRTHAGIGKWYENTVYAIQTPDAVFEFAYHQCMAAMSILQRRELIRSGLSPLRSPSSYIRSAGSKIESESYMIQTHGYSKGCCRQLTRISDLGWLMLDILQTLPAGMVDTDEAEKIRNALMNLWLACTETMRAVAREVGEDHTAYLRHRQIAVLLKNAAAPDKASLESETRLAKDQPGGFVKVVMELPISRSDKLRWIRWTVMLHISSRSYRSAENLLHGTTKHEGFLGALDLQGDSKKIRTEFLESNPKEPLEMLRLIEQAVALQLLRFSPERRLPGAAGSQRLRYAEELIHRGLNLAASIRAKKFTGGETATTEINWCEGRLMLHLGVVQSHPDIHLAKGARNPLGILSQAEALLRMSEPRRLSSEIALVDLHRAEVALNSQVISSASEVFGRVQADGSISRFEHGADPDKLRKGGSVALDAIRFLDRAEAELRLRRRNVWWTTWYFERKLRAIAYVILASSAEKDSEIPFLGLQAAVAKSDTIVDILYKDARRMVRVDVYRLASVLDAYFMCYLAFLNRVADFSNVDELQERRANMEVELSSGRDFLTELSSKREAYGTSDEAISEYAKYVLDRVQTALLA